MHREEQVLQAAKSAIEAHADIAAAVFAHQTLTLSAEDQELPAVCVNKGPDTPDSEFGVSNMAFIDSVCELSFTLYAQGQTQADVDLELDRLRVVVHKALMASPRDLGLAFVMGIRYGGAEAQEYSTAGSPLAGKRVCSFSFHYRMDIDDPE
jgi:hypothetical protein